MPDEPPLSSSGGASPATNRKVVVFGGGTGISAALEGIKESGSEVTAIVTVADDGGSSGRLRKDYHMLPPGDIRNCLVALSDGDPLLGELFNYRFEDSILKGHSFGNLFLAVLTRLTGDFRAAVDRARGLLGVTNRVIPSTSTRVVLVARHPDGTRSTGEQCISRGGKPISGMELKPQPPSISDEIKGVIAEADLLVLGPGSLFTSLVPNLLVPGMPEALAEARAPVVLVANLATQPGETDGFLLGDHVRAIRDVGGLTRLDGLIVNVTPVSDEVRERYHESGANLIVLEDGAASVEGIPVVGADLVRLTEDGFLRHDATRLAATLHGVLEAGVETEGG